MKKNFTDTKKGEEEILGKLYPIIIEEYSPKYAELYEIEKTFLKEVFGDNALRISHIGSTAVPNLASKPTVDIMVEVKCGDLTDVSDKLINCGYKVNHPEKDIVMFIKGYGKDGFEGQAYHIHVRPLDAHDEFYFRDYLLAHPDVAQKYGELKKKLCRKFEHSRDAYTQAKTKFIQKYVKLAKRV